MDDKESIEILKSMLEKYSFSLEEKEAVLNAIGILSWTKFGKNRINHIAKFQKAKKESDLKIDANKFG